MFVYVPIGYYNDAQDIIDLFPNHLFKGDEADMMVKFQKDGYGNFHAVEGVLDPESFLTPKDVSESKNMVFSSDGQYAVSFSSGSHELLSKGSDMHGFYIDVYHLEDRDDYDEYLEEIEREYSEPDVKEMTTEDLADYALGLTKKVNEAVIELQRRGYRL